MQETVRWSVIISVLCLALSLLTKFLNASPKGTYSQSHVKAGKNLVRQALYWNNVASQDENVMFASRHSDFAVAYLSAARSILPDAVLERATNLEMHDVANKLESSQREKAKRLSATCPKSNPKGSTTSSNWINI